jgi:hypothetical protein
MERALRENVTDFNEPVLRCFRDGHRQLSQFFCRLSRTSCFGQQFQAFPYLSTEVEKGASEESRSELAAAQGAQWQFIRAVNGMGIYQGI